MDFTVITDEDYQKIALSLRLDTDYDKSYVQQLVVGSRITIANRIGSDLSFYDVPANRSIFDIAVLCMVHDRYFYPGSISDDEIFEISDSLDLYVMDLKANYLVYENPKVINNGDT